MFQNNNDIVTSYIIKEGLVRRKAIPSEFKKGMDWIAFIKKHDLNKKLISEMAEIDYSRFRNVLNNGYALKPNEITSLDKAMKKYLTTMFNDAIEKS